MTMFAPTGQCLVCGHVHVHLEQVFRDYQFKHPGVKFRVGRMIVGLRQRRRSGLEAVAS